MNLLSLLTLSAAYLLPAALLAILCIGLWKNVNVFDAFIEGAREGIEISVKLIPYIMAILVAIELMSCSGLLELLIRPLRPFFAIISFPPEVLPLILIKPFSGSGYTAVLADIFKQYGTESFIGKFASILAGSTETIFYVLTIYFGFIGVKNFRHALAALITTEIAAIFIAFFVAKLFF